MTLVTSAVVGNNEARCELVRSQLIFLEEPLAPLEQADILWLLEDEWGQYPKTEFLGPVVLVGRSTQAAVLAEAPAKLGPIVFHTSWPLVYRITQQSLTVAYQAIRELRDDSRSTSTVGLFDGISDTPFELQRSLNRLSSADQSVIIQSLSGGPSDATTSANPGRTSDRSQASESLSLLNGVDLKSYLANIEQGLIEQALEDSNAVVARAADRLRIRRTTLVEKMRKYGIKRAC